jgi:ABC-type sugar transport system permease subunit
MTRKTFFIFVSPSVIIMLLLMVLPLVTAIWLGFNFITFKNLATPQWVGLENYTEVLSDPAFWASLRFTIVYILITVPCEILIGFFIALLLDQVTRYRGVYIAASLLPFIVTPIVGTLMFRNVFDRSGLYTYLLRLVFDYKLTMNTATVPVLIMLHGIWYSTPFAMITLFAGLQSLPQEPMEAATVDGANVLQRIWYVVLPHLRSLFVFIALIGIMDGYRVFDSIYVLTKQNPLFRADTVMYYNFKVAMSFGQLGKANAMAVLTVIGIFVVLVPFLVTTYRQQTEER